MYAKIDADLLLNKAVFSGCGDNRFAMAVLRVGRSYSCLVKGIVYLYLLGG